MVWVDDWWFFFVSVPEREKLLICSFAHADFFFIVVLWLTDGSQDLRLPTHVIGLVKVFWVDRNSFFICSVVELSSLPCCWIRQFLFVMITCFLLPKAWFWNHQVVWELRMANTVDELLRVDGRFFHWLDCWRSARVRHAVVEVFGFSVCARTAACFWHDRFNSLSCHL